MHICMIDENSHHSQTTTKVAARTICFLIRKRAPIESLSTSTGVNPSFRSQEPRRPRFSFFCLHNVNELTQPKLRHERTNAPQKKPAENRSSPPVARQPPCPVKKNANQWEPNKLASSTFSGYMKATNDCQHPFSETFANHSNRKARSILKATKTFFEPSQ